MGTRRDSNKHVAIVTDIPRALHSLVSSMVVVVDSQSQADAGEDFRNYADSKRHEGVLHHYTMMRKNQTLEYVKRMKVKFSDFDKSEMTNWECFDALGDFVDASDPDTDFPNIIHMFQTAESLREAGEPDWMQLVGLIHDLGKLAHRYANGAADGMDGNGGEQWGLAGDTFVVGCQLPESLVFPDLNSSNPDMQDPVMRTPLGIYEPNCGLHNTHVAFGHDEYMYMVLKNHKECTLPQAGLDIVRFHSLYCWHAGGAYRELMCESDYEMLEWVQRFQKHDLYTKHSKPPSVEELRPYYQSLIDKYIPGKLRL